MAEEKEESRSHLHVGAGLNKGSDQILVAFLACDVQRRVFLLPAAGAIPVS